MKIINLEHYIPRRGRCEMCMEIVKEIREKRKNGHAYGIEEMKGLAERFLESIKYDRKEAVPIIKIAKECGFNVICGSMKDKEMSGFVSVNENNREVYGNDKIIGINSDDELGHQRFVIAHELAHYLFDCSISGEPYFDTYIKNSHKSLKEQIANAFAVNLLIPAKDFVLQFDESKSMDNNIDAWARHFEVQKKSVEKRVIEVMQNGI